MSKLTELHDKLKALGCSNHGCLIEPWPKGSVGTNAICSCWRHKTDRELHKIFVLKDEQRSALLEEIDTLLGCIGDGEQQHQEQSGRIEAFEASRILCHQYAGCTPDNCVLDGNNCPSDLLEKS